MPLLLRHFFSYGGEYFLAINAVIIFLMINFSLAFFKLTIEKKLNVNL